MKASCIPCFIRFPCIYLERFAWILWLLICLYCKDYFQFLNKSFYISHSHIKQHTQICKQLSGTHLKIEIDISYACDRQPLAKIFFVWNLVFRVIFSHLIQIIFILMFAYNSSIFFYKINNHVNLWSVNFIYIVWIKSWFTFFLCVLFDRGFSQRRGKNDCCLVNV